jgi:hypothetical protein
VRLFAKERKKRLLKKIKKSPPRQTSILKLSGILFSSLKKESCNEKKTKYDQYHSTQKLSHVVDSEDQKDDTDDSEDFFFARRYLSSDSDLASELFSFFFKYFCFFFKIFRKSFCFEFYSFS